MAFGEASYGSSPAPPTKFNDTSPNRAQSKDNTVDLGPLDKAWIFEHLNTLNELTEPVLERSRLLDAHRNAVELLNGLLGRPVTEAYGEAQPVLLESLFFAKHGNPEAKQPSRKMGTPMLGHFLVAINGFIQVRNSDSLCNYLALEPPFNDSHMRMIQELKQAYPKGNEDVLEQKCSQNLKAARDGDEGTPWTPFVKFMVQYLGYVRDVDADASKYLQTYELLSELQVRANSALAHATLGYLILPTVVTNARLVCKLAIGLDKRPELIAHLKSGQPGGEDGGQRETLPERAANILRQAFVTCLNDRTPVARGGKPEGRKRGIYIIANICLKILFQCRKTRNATQIFENIYNLSPPLSAYPKRERVTYLYYLGRFYFQNSHFYRAQLALQQAYDESPARQECVRQRRHILVYVIASNIILGRFPSQALLSRPEAQGLADRFLPICLAIRQGNLAAFRRHLDFNSPHADWFLHFRILLQLRNRCEVLVWRSLVRKTWILNGTRPPTDTGSKAAPTVSIHDLVPAFNYLEQKALTLPDNYTDPDFQGLDVNGYDDSDATLYDTTSVESILSSLIDQGLLGGFFSHRQLKFAITGVARKGSILAAGFPQPWEVLNGKAEQDSGGGEVEVPGWKKEHVSGLGAMGGMRPGPGMVLNLSGARPVGAVG